MTDGINTQGAKRQDAEHPRLATGYNADREKGLKFVGEGIAFAGLCLSAAWLETSGYPASGLWILVVLWAFCFG